MFSFDLGNRFHFKNAVPRLLCYTSCMIMCIQNISAHCRKQGKHCMAVQKRGGQLLFKYLRILNTSFLTLKTALMFYN